MLIGDFEGALLEVVFFYFLVRCTTALGERVRFYPKILLASGLSLPENKIEPIDSLFGYPNLQAKKKLSKYIINFN